MTTGLARIDRPPTEKLGGAFFQEAYRKARGTDEEAKAADREALLGCMLAVAHRRAFDLITHEGQQASMFLVGAFLSLGLEEAAEGNPNRAVTLLKRTPLTSFIQVGEALHNETKDQAQKILREQVLVFHSSFYGILEPGLESVIRQAARKETLWETREKYQAIRERCAFAEQLVKLAGQFPVRFLFDREESIGEFHRQAYRRPSAEKPSASGGVLGLFLRSFFLSVLTHPETSTIRLPHFPNPVMDRDQTFIRYNFSCDPSRIQTLVGDIFFEPERVHAHLPKAVEALERYLEKPYGCYYLDLSFSKGRASEDMKRATRTFAKETFLQFAESVRAFFKASDHAEASENDVYRFWSSNLFLMEHRFGPGVSTNSAMKADGTDHIESLALIPPRDLADRLRCIPSWTPEARERLVQAYPWQDVFVSDLNDPNLFRLLRAAAETISPDTIFHIALPHPKPLAFWFQAWDDAEKGEKATRDGILEAVKRGGVSNRITFPVTARSIPQGMVKSADARLLRHCLEESAHLQGDAEHLTGIMPETWGWLLYRHLMCHEALRLLYERIPPKFLPHMMKKLGVCETISLKRALEAALEAAP